jgi:low temperature requirement protein LtrA
VIRRSDREAWLEVFFDLVVVAAVAVLTANLEATPTLADVALSTTLYAGIWFSWVTVVLYANIAGDQLRTRSVIVAMVAIAAMGAANPLAFPSRANTFAVGFLVVRTLCARASWRTGRVLVGWPILQLGGLTFPWVVSLFVAAPAKYGIWAATVAADLLLVVVRSRRGDAEDTSRFEQRINERQARHRGPDGRVLPPLTFTSVRVDVDHLAERLGLFVIIVLGEAVAQVVHAISDLEWSREVRGSAIASVVILAALWWISFGRRLGQDGTGHEDLSALPLTAALPIHLVETMGIVGLAVGLGTAATHATEPLSPALRWITCAGLALHFVGRLATAVLGHRRRGFVLAVAVPCVLWPLALASLGTDLPPSTFLYLLSVPVLVTLLWPRVQRHLDARAAGASPTGSAPARS